MAAPATHLEAEVLVVEGDLDHRMFDRLLASPMLSWDIETTGLDWRNDRIGTVQVHDRGQVVLVRRLKDRPERLKRLLEAPGTRKVLHHAMFDLRFMAASWGVSAANVSCTKIAAKLLRVPKEEQSLAPLVSRYLGVTLDKSEQVSDWTAAHLSDAQLAYAAADVSHLEALIACLRDELESQDKWTLAEACFAHIPTRVALELQAYPDVFVY